jgi:hypothetical protein
LQLRIAVQIQNADENRDETAADPRHPCSIVLLTANVPRGTFLADSLNL